MSYIYAVEVVHYNNAVVRVAEHTNEQDAFEEKVKQTNNIRKEWKQIIHNKNQLPQVRIVKLSSEALYM